MNFFQKQLQFQNLHVASSAFLLGDAFAIIGGFDILAPPAGYSLSCATKIRLEPDPDLSRRNFLAGLLDLRPDDDMDCIDLL